MNSGRQELASLILSSGMRLNGELIETPKSAFGNLRRRLSDAGVGACDVVVLRGLQSRDLIIANLAVWQLDGVPMPTSAQPTAPVARESFQITEDLSVLPGGRSRRPNELEATAVLHTTSGSRDQPQGCGQSS